MLTGLPVYLVSLEVDVDRREKLAELFPVHSSSFIRVDAVDGRVMAAREYYSLVAQTVACGDRLMLPGEVGCSLSHIHALQKFLETESEKALILEDDVIGSDGDLDTVASLAETIPDECVLLCGGQEGMPSKQKYLFGKQIGGREYCQVAPFSYDFIFRTCCYVVTRASARRILDCHAHHLRLADAWGEFFRSTPIRVLFAPVLKHPDDLEGSHLQAEREDFHGAVCHSRNRGWYYRKKALLLKKIGALLSKLAGYKALFPN